MVVGRSIAFILLEQHSFSGAGESCRQQRTRGGKSPVPAHVPAHLVFDFDVYNAAAGITTFTSRLKRLHEPDVPEVFWTPRNGGHWVLTRGEDIHKVFADFEHFSNHALTVPRSAAPPIPLYPIFLDPPDHATFRSLINPWFSPKAVAGLEPKARALAVELIEGLKPRGRCDFVTDFAQHLPIQVFMSIVDVPASDRHDLLHGPTAWCALKSPKTSTRRSSTSSPTRRKNRGTSRQPGRGPDLQADAGAGERPPHDARRGHGHGVADPDRRHGYGRLRDVVLRQLPGSATRSIAGNSSIDRS